MYNQHGDQLGLVCLAGADFSEVHVGSEQFLFQFLHVHDLGDRDNREFSEVRVDDNRLCIRVADDADAGVTLEFGE